MNLILVIATITIIYLFCTQRTGTKQIYGGTHQLVIDLENLSTVGLKWMVYVYIYI